MRLFVAITLPPHVKDALAGTARALAELDARGSFTRRENFHLTLAFLGETGRLDAVRRAMGAVCARPFHLRAAGLGCFRRKSGDIWWVGVEPDPALLDIQRQLACALRAEGFALEERPFRPHLTLARRVRLPHGLDPAAVEGLFHSLEVPVDALTLMQSQRLDGVLCYTPVCRRSLL